LDASFHGALLVDKPQGPTSHDVVARVRRWVKPSRTGHTGTLDPMATGVLAVCVGAATRLVRFLSPGPKEYSGRLILGVSTDTYDAEGRVVLERPAEKITAETARRAAEDFTGDLMQLPPPWSAKKVGGRRSYDLARAGEAPDLKPCPVRVERFELLEMRRNEIEFRVLCSPGTYIRSLVHNLGEALGCGAHLSILRRLRTGPFQVSSAVALAEMEAAGREGRLAEHLISLEDLDLGMASVRLMVEGVRSALAGRKIPPSEVDRGGIPGPGRPIRLLDPGDRLLGVAELDRHGGVLLQPRVILTGGPAERAARRGSERA
jgi:tRNA pseudouridine55 synthase